MEHQGPATTSPYPQSYPPVQQIDKLAEALAKAQAKFKPPLKRCKVDFIDRNNRRVKYNYADLADVLAAITGPLTENGLALTHQLLYSGNLYGLKTTLIHTSGQMISTWYPMPDPLRGEIRPQEFGSALTYARRYSSSSLVGIASEDDDDGQSAPTIEAPQKQTRTALPKKENKKPEPKNRPGDSGGRDWTPASDEKIANIEALALERSVRPEELNYLVANGYQIKNQERVPNWMADEILAILSDESCTAATIMAAAERMKNERAAKKAVENSSDPANYVMPLGAEGVVGKKLIELSEATLKKALAWAEEQLKVTPPPPGIAKVVEMKTKISKFLDSVGVK